MTDLTLRILLQAQDLASDVINGIGGSLQSLNGILLGVGIAATVGLGVAAVSAAGDFQQAMNSLVAHAGLAKDQVGSISQAILDMDPIVGRAPTQLAEALYPILSAFSGIQNESAKSAISLQTLKNSFETVAGTTVDGTAVANAAVGTFNALGLATDNVSTNTERMNNLFDIMDKTVQLGNMQWDQYKNVISKLAVSIQGTGVSFNEASAALAEMTNEGFSAQKAQTYLSNTFTSIEIKTDSLAKHAKALGISFDESKYGPMTLAQKIEYLNQITDGNKQKLLALMGSNSTALKTFNALSVGIDGYKSNLDALNHSQGALASSFETASSGFNFSMQKLQAAGQVLLVTIGSGLLPILTQLVNVAIIPLIGYITDFSAHANMLVPILSGIGAAILAALLPPLVTLIPAIWSAAAGMIALTWPFLLVGAAVAALIAIFMHFYQTSAPFKSFVDNIVAGLLHMWSVIQANFIPAMMQIGAVIQKYVFPFLAQIGAYIAQQFAPLWGQLVDLWQSQVIPAFQQLAPLFQQIWKQLQALAPILQIVGAFIGVYLVVNIAVLIGMITGLAKGLATFLSGLITFVSGAIQYFTGVVQLFTGIVNFIADLATGKFGKLGSDLSLIWTGIQNMFMGGWKMIEGLFQMSIGTIISFVQGFVDGIIKFFVSLWNDLIGHSIIPDMINGIISWFLQLPGRAGEAVASMASKVLSLINNLANDALNAGENIVKNIATGITNAIGNIGSAIGTVTQYISDHLPHSPAKLGPLRDLAKQGTLIVKQIGQGMESSTPTLQASINTVTQPIASSFNAGGFTHPVGVSTQGGSTTNNYIFYIDGRSARTDQDLVNMLMDKLNRQLNRSGSMAPWISGGRA